jgi:hypothetical protein
MMAVRDSVWRPTVGLCVRMFEDTQGREMCIVNDSNIITFNVFIK